MMHCRHLRELLYGFCSALLIRANFAFQLQPIDLLENEAKHVAVRDNDYSKLDLLSFETFLWGGRLTNPVLHFSQDTDLLDTRS
jgi:hypothetical protein